MDPFTKSIIGLINTSGGLYTLPRVDYHEFRTRWLPLFNAESNPNGYAPLGEWVQQVARGNSFLGVEVVKGGMKVVDEMYGGYTIQGGEVMFVVPPILNRDIKVKLDADKKDTEIDDVLIKGDAISKTMAVAGKRYIENNLINKIQIDIPVDPRLSEKMDKIFEHFGVKRTKHIEPAVVAIEAPKTATVTEEEKDSDIDYDFF